MHLVGATERRNCKSLTAFEVSDRWELGTVKNFRGVLHMCALRIPRLWVDSMGRHGVQFTAQTK